MKNNYLRMITLSLILGIGGFTSCGPTKNDALPTINIKPRKVKPGIKVIPFENQELQTQLQAIHKFQNMSAADFQKKHKTNFTGSISYTPSTATHMDLIQASTFSLSVKEKTTLDKHGFVIAKGLNFPSFAHGYETIYMEDLPLFVSADSILEAVHRSYDDILQQIELEVLIPELETLLTAMRAKENATLSGYSTKVQSDIDLYLTIALRLLTEKGDTLGSADPKLVDTLYDKALAAEGMEERTLFGSKRILDFSQFKPRGHYTDSPELSRYFRAMMWLGRIDLRFLEPNAEDQLVFHRDQFEMAVALFQIMDPNDKKSWKKIHDTIGAFVGEPDSMIVTELDELLNKLQITNTTTLAAVSDQDIINTIQSNGYGAQRISSHIMMNGTAETKPLSATFMLFGQRYVLDSHVFSNVVYDRVNNEAPKRMMPDPLDVAFAALGNDYAGELLQSELTKYEYAYDLESMRYLADQHDENYWNMNLYNMWMGSLRLLSPSHALDPNLPSTVNTAAWSKRLLNTQLASWAELRHDTILYAKQSYSSGISCEYPDAYVDPYPEFFRAIANYADRGLSIIKNLGLSNSGIETYFQRTKAINLTLAEMADYQKAGTPFTTEMMAFINDAVRLNHGCGGPATATGWYSELYYDSESTAELDPVIADVHTQPSDEAGNPVGRVLHVGTGLPRTMVVTLETCNGPRAYVGLVSSFYTKITKDFKRYNDEEWSEELMSTDPEDPTWMKDIAVK